MGQISLLPIDIGWDLRVHPDVVVEVPDWVTSVKFSNRKNQTKVAFGPVEKIKRRLRAAGYRVV